jgi:hypothetical protein
MPTPSKDDKPAPTLVGLRQLLTMYRSNEHLIALVRNAGFEIRTTGPTPYETQDDQTGQVWPNHMYLAEILVEGIWYGQSTLTTINDDPAFIAMSHTRSSPWPPFTEQQRDS